MKNLFCSSCDIPKVMGIQAFVVGRIVSDTCLEENASGRAGLMSELSLNCDACDESTTLQTSTNITKRGKSFDVNRRAAYHSIETGIGYEGLASFCGIMNMPCLSTRAYYKQVDNILEALEDETREELVSGGQRLRQIFMEEERLYFIDRGSFCNISGHWWGLRLPCIVEGLPKVCLEEIAM